MTDVWSAEEYHRFSSGQQQWAQELINKLALNGNETLLDIGCGDGKITARLASILDEGKVVGIDSSQNMIAFANETYPPVRFGNLEFHLMNAESIELPYKFDVVFSNAVLHWVTDHVSVLRRVHDHLTEAGRILFQKGGKGNAAGVLAAVDDVIQSSDWSSYFRDFILPYSFYGIEEYSIWLREAGFDAKRIELVPKDMEHQGKEGLEGWLRTAWHPYTNRVSETRREDFISAVAEKYISQNPPVGDDIVHVAMIRLEVEAVAS